VVICTAYSDYSLDQMTARLGRTDRMLILKKPFDAIEVLQFADALTEKWRLGREARAKVEDLEARVAERTQELREQQQQLIEARKMELVGKLAGGIAHDFNSLLTAIIGHADLIRQAVPDGQLPSRSAAQIADCAVRAAALTHQLLGFSRRQMLRLEPLDANAAIADIGPVLGQTVGRAISVSTVAKAGNPWAKADALQLQKVLISLANNARDAMPRGGKLTLETANVTIPKSADGDLSAGDYVMISVTDTGSGIPHAVKPHIFEPYFTTKTPGAGKGLGLAMCYGILKQSGGHLGFESHAGRGAIFKIYLPCLKEAKMEATLAGTPVAALPQTGVILLAEKDETLRAMAATVLEKQGYTVYRASGCREAISISGSIPRVDLLLAEAAMREMTGTELSQWLCALHPEMKTVFFLSGDEEMMLEKGDGVAVTHHLRKPYTPSDLLARVRGMLDEGGRDAEMEEGSARGRRGSGRSIAATGCD
jgi:signal transduction histidine kinase/CheY-like chemotaxis protein